MISEDNIENLYREQFKNFKPELSDELKKRIQAQADKKAKAVRLKRLFKFWAWLVGTGTAILIASYVAFDLSNAPQEQNLVIPVQGNNDNDPLTNPSLSAMPETLDVWENPTVEISSEEFTALFVNPDPNDLEDIDTMNIPELPMVESEISNSELNVKRNPDLYVGEKDANIQHNKPKKVLPMSNNYGRYPDTKKGHALYQAELLRQGALLVRLKTGARSIAEMKKRGYHAMARKKEVEIFNENKAIYQAFKENFTFCKVYFFYSTASDSIRNNALEGIFVNENLETDTSIKLNERFYMIADIGTALEAASSRTKEQHRNTDYLDRVIVLSDWNFEQMSEPFPYYQKASWAIADQKNVRRLSDKLRHFYFSK